jgi:hypothetical protein
MGTLGRLALYLLTAALLVLAGTILLHDVRHHDARSADSTSGSVPSGDVNCGSAIFARHVRTQSFDTGQVAIDDFNSQQAADDCEHLIFRQRYLTALTLAGAGVAYWFARRPDRRPVKIPGDPVV